VFYFDAHFRKQIHYIDVIGEHELAVDLRIGFETNQALPGSAPLPDLFLMMGQHWLLDSKARHFYR
jgi:hypothetical protein